MTKIWIRRKHLAGECHFVSTACPMSFYHMTRTDPRAISLENHMKKKSGMRAVRLALAGPEKAVRPY